jgi:hypothetical protein
VITVEFEEATDGLRRERSNVQREPNPGRVLRLRQYRVLIAVLSVMLAGHTVAAIETGPIVSPELSNKRAAAVKSSDPRLPADVPLRIIVRYFAEDAIARQRAIDLSRGLGEQGLNVADLVGSATRGGTNTVNYFYAEDQLGAAIAARGLGPDWKCVQRRIGANEPMPRAGTLELVITSQ